MNRVAVDSAGTVVVAALTNGIERLWSEERAVYSDLPDSVHRMRVAARRLRSVLRSYRTLFIRREVDPMRDELHWLTLLLGSARDAQVQVERLRARTAALPDDPACAAAVERLVEVRVADYRVAHEAVVTALLGARYAALRSRLRSLSAAPPLRSPAHRPAAEVVESCVVRDVRRLDRLTDAASRSGPDEMASASALHNVRKGARRLRYAAETGGGQFGPMAELAKRLQTVLGDYHDAVECELLALATARRARSAGEDIDPYITIAAAESAAAAHALAEYPTVRTELMTTCHIRCNR